MSFDSPLFIFFLSTVLIVHYLLPSKSARRCWEILTSLFFLSLSGLWSSLIFSAFVICTFIAARLIWGAQKHRKIWLGFAVSFIFLCLAGLRWHQGTSIPAFFPFGFSFYSFAAVTYLVDMYDRNAKPCFFNFVSAILFFPVLGSGPIVRSLELIRQQEESIPLDWSLARRSAVRIGAGFFKKGISEFISITMLSRLGGAESLPGAYTWLYIATYMAKYYADFSGYSDIAIGSAGFLGIEVPNNFNLPFFADSIVNFWRRWHMTLNWWTNQYVFRPLVYSDALAVLRRLPGVGEKIFQHREYIAVLLAMSVIGIWHGLTINYLLWGAYMGALICFELRWASGFQRQCPRPLRIFLTFFLVLNGFVIFLSSSPANAARMWTKMYSSQVFMALAWPPRHVGLCGIVLAVPHLIDAVLIKAGHFEKRPWIALATCVVFFSLHFFMDGFYGAIFEYSKF